MDVEIRRCAIDAAQVIALYERSTLAERRPVHRPDMFAAMLANTPLLVSAWIDGHLVGLARTLTDFSYVAYLADLAVDAAYQRRGIGKRLIEETRASLQPECMLVLIAAPAANDYYPQLGFEHNPRAWVLPGQPA